MKKISLLFLIAAFAGFVSVSCSDDPEEKVVPPDVESVAGIEPSYAKGQHEYLEITPDVSLSNDNEQGVTYEWKGSIVQVQRAGRFQGLFQSLQLDGCQDRRIHAPRLLAL